MSQARELPPWISWVILSEGKRLGRRTYSAQRHSCCSWLAVNCIALTICKGVLAESPQRAFELVGGLEPLRGVLAPQQGSFSSEVCDCVHEGNNICPGEMVGARIERRGVIPPS